MKERETEEKIFHLKETEKGQEKENIIHRGTDMKKIVVDRGTEPDSKLREADSHPSTEKEKGIMIIRVQRAILSLSIEHITQNKVMERRDDTTAERTLTTDKAKAEITIFVNESMIEYQVCHQ